MDQRIIPARAGFTRAVPWGADRGPDHPRSRGVYVGVHLDDDRGAGSSPLARGLRERLARGLERIRIIPARAGFTSRRSPRTTLSRDHPRSRGVYAAETAATAMTQGSSPLARGLPDQRMPEFKAHGSSPLARGLLEHDSRRQEPSGIIPARAGFTARHVRLLGRVPDHPRSRGVYESSVPHLTPEAGSSPLARGLREYERVACRQHGIIPARAGFTTVGA